MSAKLTRPKGGDNPPVRESHYGPRSSEYKRVGCSAVVLATAYRADDDAYAKLTKVGLPVADGQKTTLKPVGPETQTSR
jgi:hypothetical protein